MSYSARPVGLLLLSTDYTTYWEWKMTSNTPLHSCGRENSDRDPFRTATGPSLSARELAAEVASTDPAAAKLVKAGIPISLLPDDEAAALTAEKQEAADRSPLAGMAAGFGAPLRVPQPVKSKSRPGFSYVQD